MLSTRFASAFVRCAIFVACQGTLLFFAPPQATFGQTTPARTAAPVISPPTGSYSGAQTVSITDSNSSATIYYTTDGTTPTTSSPTYAGSFQVSTTSTVQAIAVAGGSTNSLSASAVYTFNNVAVNLNVVGGDPYTMTCTVAGASQFSSSGPTGTVTFTDTATAQTLGTATLGTASAVPQLQYVDNNQFPPGEGGMSLATADFNGDGKIDIVTGDAYGVYLSLGNGDGAFQPPALIASPPNGSAQEMGVAIGDFNGDGKMDVAITQITVNNPGSAPQGNWVGAVAVYLGNGDGTFQAPVTYATGTGPEQIIAADFGNGKLDLAVTDDAENVAWVLMGNGDGTFQNAVSYPTGKTPSGLLAGNFTGHGHLDLALSNIGDRSVSILPGNGDGTFGTQVVTTGVDAGFGLAASDFNRDGRLDLAVASDPAQITILLGNGDGTFQYAPSLNVSIKDGTVYSVAAADLNGDGIPDLAAVTYASGYVAVAMGKGDGTFAAPTLVPVANLGVGTAVALAAFAGGSTPEIAAAYDSAMNVGVDQGVGFEVFAYTGDFSALATLSNVTVTAGSVASHPIECSYGGDSHYADGVSNVMIETFAQLATPVFSLLVGVYNAPQTVSISDANSSAAIYYTSDGSTPTENSTLYTGSIPVSTTTTFKAIAVQTGYTNSAISEAAYTFAATPGFSPSPGSYASAQQVTITDTTPGATLYYTTDGTTPTVKSNVYSSPVRVSGQTTVQALAVAPGYLNSAIESGTYAAGAPQATTTTLQASSLSLATGQQVTLTATVTGNNPTGTVTFTAGGTVLGTGAVSGGNATLQTSFATAGTYAVTAAYGGDNANASSTSSAVTIVVASPDYSIQAAPPSATINPGQSATFTFTVSATGGYSGTINFSCGSLPSEASCTFNPASVNPAGATAVSTLTINTTAPMTSRNSAPSVPWTVTGSMALAGMAGLFLAPVTRRRWARYLRGVSLGLLAAACAATFVACGGGASDGTGSANPGTPAGSYNVQVTASASGGGPQHALGIALIVQ